MGASGWEYIVPYEADVQQALDRLRERVFAEGKYHCRIQEAKRILNSETERQRLIDLIGEQADDLFKYYETLIDLPEPQSIEELIELQAEDGTHSILDVNRVSYEPRRLTREIPPYDSGAPFQQYLLEYVGSLGSVYPLTEADLREWFDTDQPTREDLERCEIPDGFDRGVGFWVVLYRDGSPDELLFSGVSGD